MAIGDLTFDIDLSSDPFATPTWSGITTNVRGMMFDRGGAETILTLQPAAKGTIIVDNNDNDIDPLSSYQYCQCRVRAENTSGAQTVFTGYILTARQSYDGFDQVISIEVTDIVGILANAANNINGLDPTYDDDGRETWEGGVPEERTSERFDRIINAISTNIDKTTNLAAMVCPEPADDEKDAHGFILHHHVIRGSVTEYLRLLAESEGGAINVDRAGMLTFYNRTGYWDKLQAAVTATFADNPSAGQIGYRSERIEWAVPSDQRYDVVQMTRRDGIMQTAGANANANWPTAPYSLSNLVLSADAMAEGNAEAFQRFLSRSDVWIPEVRVAQLKPPVAATLDYSLAVDIGSVVNVKITPKGQSQQTYLSIVTGISHRMSVGGKDWETVYRFMSGDRIKNAFSYTSPYVYPRVGTAVASTSQKIGF